MDGQFERYDKRSNSWNPAPEQSCIFVGEDLDYEEITDEQAKEITILV
jgi:hypothetical protein